MRSGSFEPMQTGILLFLFFRINHMPCRTCYFFVWDLHQANCHWILSDSLLAFFLVLVQLLQTFNPLIFQDVLKFNTSKLYFSSSKVPMIHGCKLMNPVDLKCFCLINAVLPLRLIMLELILPSSHDTPIGFTWSRQHFLPAAYLFLQWTIGRTGLSMSACLYTIYVLIVYNMCTMCLCNTTTCVQQIQEQVVDSPVSLVVQPPFSPLHYCPFI